MFDELRTLAESHGDRLAVVSMENIHLLQADLAKFRSEKDSQLGDFQKHIFDEYYRFDQIPAHMRSIIIVAVRRPAYAKVTFARNGKEYKAFSGVAAALDKTVGYITDTVQAAGFDINRETRLPLRRIAVQSGMGQYGRNNIVYVDGMGSAAALMAFSTDAPCDNDNWREPVVSPICNDCKICLTLCPTNAITPDRFHIDSHKCLTRLNRSPDDFPDWVPPTAYHSTYYCLMCQGRCPMNKGLETIEVSFSETETARIMDGGPYDDASEQLKSKLARLNFEKIATAPRNLRVLFEAMDAGHVPKL
ncbi:MAG: hypothetical protein LBE55_06265 [Clostridiales bacterium]|jgi:epoxyqueuosine reductase|nr:hypothetical protein [Clostridiales bacterium]